MSRNTPNRTHAQALVELRTGKSVTKNLQELYVDRGLSQVDTAIELGVSRLTVAMWLREFGVERPAATSSPT